MIDIRDFQEVLIQWLLLMQFRSIMLIQNFMINIMLMVLHGRDIEDIWIYGIKVERVRENGSAEVQIFLIYFRLHSFRSTNKNCYVNIISAWAPACPVWTAGRYPYADRSQAFMPDS